MKDIRLLVENEFNAVNNLIIQSLESKVESVSKIGHYIVDSGGKRLRPLLMLLMAKACQADMDKAIHMAVIIEFIHTATLLHDDVVDDSTLRRGRPTANAVWDNATAVLVGDFIYSRAFQLVSALNIPEITEILAQTTNVIAEGEVLQLSHRQQPDITEAQYLRVIDYKTAKLFEATSLVAGILAGFNQAHNLSLAQFGRQLGTAFQLTDDMLDYQSNNPNWGKNVGDDLAEGKATLPLIYALKNSDAPTQKIIRQAITEKGTEHLERIQAAIVSTGALDYTQSLAQNAIQEAQAKLSFLPESAYKTGLYTLADFVLTRNR